MAARTAPIDLAPRSDGARYRRVMLGLEDGSLVLSSHEVGSSLEAAWGLDDEEVTVTLGPDQLARLALALVSECLDGRDPVAALTELCEEHGVDFRAACWT